MVAIDGKVLRGTLGKLRIALSECLRGIHLAPLATTCFVLLFESLYKLFTG
jgi:hypothetical protein